jgi:ribose 5-phosphate isomerase B
MNRKIFIASDHAGFELKSEILRQSNELMVDLGTNNSFESVDYPDYANSLVNHLKLEKEAVGILICGSGIGMAIAANRDKDVRAGLAFKPEIAKLMRQHNDANVLVLPGRFINVQEALNCVDNFLSTKYEYGRHNKRIKKLNKYQNE